MKLDLTPVPAVHWDENERTGYRHIGITNAGVKIFSLASYKMKSGWECKLIPMGFSYTKEETVELKNLFNTIVEVMEYLEKDDEITHDDILDFLGHFQ